MTRRAAISFLGLAIVWACAVLAQDRNGGVRQGQADGTVHRPAVEAAVERIAAESAGTVRDSTVEAAPSPDDAWEGETYVLSVGEMEILHDVNTDDTWSPAPDLVVRVSRPDPEVSRQIRRLEIANESREERRRKVTSARDELRKQRQESARQSVKPLTGEQAERLSALLEEVGDICAKSRAVCGGCPGGNNFDTCQACAKCPELELLQWRKRESERVPVPLLTEMQLRLLEYYEEEVLALAMEIGATEKEVMNLKRLIYGASRQIETDRLIVDFGDQDVIRVHPGDRITVSVWDNDVFDDDLYGRTTVTLDRETLERGTLDVSMPNIRFVRLRFRRDDMASTP